MNRLLFAVLLLLSAHLRAYVESPAGTFTTTGAQSDVQSAINAASANAIIIIPAGTHTWSTVGNGVTINQINNITIQGAGIDVTIINDECDGGLAHAVFYFQNYHLSGRTFKITGMTIDSHATLYSTHTILTSAPSCEISRIKMTDIGTAQSTRGIFVSSAGGNYPMANATIFGCELIGRGAGGASQLITVIGNDYGFPPTVESGTNSSWYLPAGMGGPLATFVENCTLTNTFNQDSTIETYSGGRVVVRYSTLNTFFMGAHGNDSSTRSGHTMELYNCTINQTLGSGMPNEVDLRGGTLYYYNCTITQIGVGTTNPADLQVYRAAGFSLANGNPSLISLLTAAGNFVTGRTYTISVPGTTTWTDIGAANNSAGTVFVASGAGSGTGTASNTAYVGQYTYNPTNDRYVRNSDTTRYFAYVSGEWRLYGDGLHQLTHPGAGTLMRDQVVTYPAGAYAASGVGDIVVSSGGVTRIYNNNLLNGGQPTDNNTAVPNGSGTHTGSSGAAVLTDSTKSWTVDGMLGYGTAAYDDELFSYCVWNLTSGASAFVTANTGTTLTAPLSGGSRQTWSTGDSYVITMGYPGLDMVGRVGPTRFFATYSTQDSAPIYLWNNYYNGSPDVRTVQVSWNGDYDATNSPRISELVQSGREYFNNAGAPPGYTPYIYPHPLRAMGPGASIKQVQASGPGVGF